MQNFNTNQTRHFYAVKTLLNSGEPAAAGDVVFGQTQTGELFFKYMNADGLATRTDTLHKDKIVSVRYTDDLDVPILGHSIELTAEFESALSTYVGKAISCMVTVHQVYDFDDSTSLTYTATVIGNSTNTASAPAFYKALAVEIAKVVPELYVKVYAGSTVVTKKTAVADITGSPTSVILIPQIQKFVRGKLSAETATLSVAFRAHDGEDTVWGTDSVDTVKNLGADLTPKVIPGGYIVADLEYFSLGERGDMYRGFRYPNDWATTYAIDPTAEYEMVSVEYYWNGDAENVQKSPRLLEFASKKTDGAALAIFNAIAAMEGVSGAIINSSVTSGS